MKGFGKPKLTEAHQTFRVEYKAVNPNDPDDEQDIETVLYKVPLSKGTAEDRRYLVAATVAFEKLRELDLLDDLTPEQVNKIIDSIGVWTRRSY